MNPSELILQGARPPGIYRFANVNADYLIEPLTRQGWRGFFIEGKVITDKATFLRMAGAALNAPTYVGHNWDAFEEALRDLAWAPALGYVLIYDGVWHLAWHDQAAWQTVHAILADTVAFWRTMNTPFYVLLSRTWWYARDVEKLE